MNVIVQADHIIPEEMAKIQNQVESRTVKTEMITNETTYSITSKISTTVDSLAKRCNVALARLGGSLRARREAAICFVA